MRLTAADLAPAVDACPFARLLGFEVTAVLDDGLTMTMPMHERLERVAGTGQIHGGPIAALIDTAATFAVVAATAAAAPTVDLRIDYLRPAMASALTATAVVRRAGRTMGVADVDVHDEGQRLIAIGRGTFLVAPAGNGATPKEAG